MRRTVVAGARATGAAVLTMAVAGIWVSARACGHV